MAHAHGRGGPAAEADAPGYYSVAHPQHMLIYTASSCSSGDMKPFFARTNTRGYIYPAAPARGVRREEIERHSQLPAPYVYPRTRVYC